MTASSPSSPAFSLAAVIVAAGGGRRMGDGIEKQFRLFAGKPVLAHAAAAFLAHPATARLVMVVADGRETAARDALAGLADDPRVRICTGGVRRQDSVRAGLAAAAGAGVDLVSIHDAARPWLDGAMITRLLDAMHDGAAAALPVLPVVDTLKLLDGGNVTGTSDRSRLGRAQTPQMFRLDRLVALHDAHDPAVEVTDDILLFEAAGEPIAAVPGDERLMKLTTPADFAILSALTSGLSGQGDMDMPSDTPLPDIRTGNGFDVHRFGDTPGPVILAGVEIPHDRGLAAHSDGDVGLHALCDAIFGALADGDIGSHFPPSEARWKDAESGQFLTFASERCAGRGAVILHLDLTLICETPKVGPYREAMRKRIAALADIDIERVAVKATTSEKLGFTGRGEGIAAQATATLAFTGTPIRHTG
ncbi:MAG: 2-C-methyl-D-erythritol 4-phosphate cytidylyltransferase [Candidatus Puniceispirillaceae bacterium]